MSKLSYVVELAQEPSQGKYIAEVIDVPGVMAYGSDGDSAVSAVKVLLEKVLRGMVKAGEEVPRPDFIPTEHLNPKTYRTIEIALEDLAK